MFFQLLPGPYSLFPIPYSLFPIPCSLEQDRFGVKIGVDYPRTIVDLWQSLQENEKIYNPAQYSSVKDFLNKEEGRRKRKSR